MDNEDKNISKFMLSMMNSNELGNHNNTNDNNTVINSDNIWYCFSYMFKIKNIWLLFSFLILASFLNLIDNYYALTDNIPFLILLCMSIFMIIGIPLLTGYIFDVIEIISDSSNIIALPKFKTIKSFTNVVKGAVAFLFGIIIFIVATIIPLVISILMYEAKDPFVRFVGLILGLFLIALFIGFLLLSPAFILYFVKTKKLSSFIQYPTIFNLIKNNDKNYLYSVGLIIGFCLVLYVVSFLIIMPFNQSDNFVPIVYNLFPLFLNAIIMAYAILVEIFICAKCLKFNNIKEL